MNECICSYPKKNIITIEVPGNPVPWKRAVPTSHGMIDVQRQLKLYWGITIKGQFEKTEVWASRGDNKLFTGPLGMKVTYYFPMAKTQMKRWGMMDNTWHYNRPDTSNCTKYIEDAVTDILYKDDCLIALTWAEKRYSYNPRTVMELFNL